MSNEDSSQVDGAWAIVELFGHRRVAGTVHEVTIAGAPMLRIDVFEGDAKSPSFTEYKNAQGAVYGIVPTTEDLCRRFSAAHKPQPVAAYELPKLPPIVRVCTDCGTALDEEEQRACDARGMSDYCDECLCLTRKHVAGD